MSSCPRSITAAVMALALTLMMMSMAPRTVGSLSVWTLEYGFLADDAAVKEFAQVILESGGIIEGNVEISESVTSLKGLEGLTEVGGDLVLNNHAFRGIGETLKSSLNSLAGLENLEKVGGDLKILHNPLLFSLSGLDSLKEVGGQLRLYQNGNLRNLSGLESLQRIGGSLTIEEETNLLSLAALSSLEELNGLGISKTAITSLGDIFDGITSLDASLYITGNDKLASLKGLEDLSTVGSGVTVWENDQLTSLTGLEGLTKIGYGNIKENLALTSLDALSNLERVDDHLTVEKNEKLLSEEGLESVMLVGKSGQGVDKAAPDFSGGSLLQIVASVPILIDEVDVWLILEDDTSISAVGDFVSKRGGVFSETLKITGDGVTSLAPLSNLTTVDGDLYITDTTNLSSLTPGLEALKEVRGDLHIMRNANLASVDASLEGLTTVGGALFVDDPSAAAALQNLVSTGVTLNVYETDTLDPFADLFGQPILQSLLSLPDLADKVDVTLKLDNDELVSAVGDFAASRGGVFPGSLEISGDVTSLESLEALTEVRGHLDISNSPQLTSLAGLERLTSVGGYFWVIENVNLSPTLDDSLSSLESVGGDLVLLSYHQMERSALQSSLSSLYYVGGDVNIYWNTDAMPIFSFAELWDQSYQVTPLMD